jgi:oligopeptide/dipeptide ABC transporter ATP-binding protein
MRLAGLLQVIELKKYFYETSNKIVDFLLRKKVVIKAVDGVTFELEQGGSLGIAGETGCGKSTLGKTIVRMLEPTEGQIIFDGVDIGRLSYKRLLPYRRLIQYVSQNPYSSLNPRRKIKDILTDVASYHRLDEPELRAEQYLSRVGLGADLWERYPYQLSGGQLQRVAIARALILEPKLVVFDEIASALDVSTQTQILTLILELRREMNLTYIFISHNLGVLRQVCERLAVMYLGKFVEVGKTTDVLRSPMHPYTQALVKSIPEINEEWNPVILQGDPPSQIIIPEGCRFHPRCPYVLQRCLAKDPPLFPLNKGRKVACYLHEEKAAE